MAFKEEEIGNNFETEVKYLSFIKILSLNWLNKMFSVQVEDNAEKI